MVDNVLKALTGCPNHKRNITINDQTQTAHQCTRQTAYVATMHILIMPLTAAALQLMSYKIETHNELKHVHKQAHFYNTLQVQYAMVVSIF